MNSWPTLTRQELMWLQGLITSGREHLFYVWSKWLITRTLVLKHDKYECQDCKARKRYSKAVLVHHEKHLKVRPDLALSLVDEHGNRQLTSLCKPCHELRHPERSHNKKIVKKPYVTAERWD